MNLLGTTDNLDVVTIDGASYSNDALTNTTYPVPSLDTATDGGNDMIAPGAAAAASSAGGGLNPIGDFSYASSNGGGSTVPTNSTPSWLDTVTKTFNNVAANLQTGKSKTGTPAVDQEIAALFGKTNPPPLNTNTNLANKGLNAWATMLHQLNFNPSGGTVPGVQQGANTRASNWWVVAILGVGVLFLLIPFIVRGR
jgi:hypothetical protein